mmetsp:Transcript_26490/g.42570  ORF Transcript_26490/g.42570 Transcript_26490/m.42570 type:complete len:369 (+) Transcript_26490:94-1200(+)
MAPTPIDIGLFICGSAVILLGIPISLLHQANLLLSKPMQTTNIIAAKNVQRHRIATAFYCWMCTIGLGSACLSIGIVNNNSSDRTCLAMKMIVILSCFLAVVMKNVVLITRSSLIDPNGERHCLRTLLCGFVMLYMFIFLGIIVVRLINVQKRRSIDGADLVCVMIFTLQQSLTYLFVDVVLSGISLVLFIPPLWKPFRNENQGEYREIAIRATTSQAISVLITMVTVIIIIIEDKGDDYIPIRQGSLLICCDAAAGFFLLANTWKIKFYRRVTLDVLCQMNLVVDDSKTKESKTSDNNRDQKCADPVIVSQEACSKLKNSTSRISASGTIGVSQVNSSRVSVQSSVMAIKNEDCNLAPPIQIIREEV